MKRIILAMLMACCLIVACGCGDSALKSNAAVATETPAPTAEEPTPTPEPTPSAAIAPADADDSYEAEQAAAADCRVQAGNAEYYLDTTAPVNIYVKSVPEYPLFKKDLGSGAMEYLGTTGASFQLFESYIYIRSGAQQEDYPDGSVTRVVNVETGSIRPFLKDVEIFLPQDGNYVYYTRSNVSAIFQADASLEYENELTVEIPEKEEIETRCGISLSDNRADISITGMAGDLIDFTYYVSDFQGKGIYVGNYHMNTSGHHVERTDEGHYFE